MALLPHEQAAQLIRHAKRILVVTTAHASVDAQSSVIALGLLLGRWQREYDLVIPDTRPEQRPEYLPASEMILPAPGALRDLKLHLNVARIGVHQVTQHTENDTLTLSIVPEKDAWSEQDVRLVPGDERYDLIIAVACAERLALGELATEYAEILGRTPTINLDYHASNEYWGHVNLVDITASSTSEVVLHWIESVDASVMDEDLATCILAGMIEQTHGFRAGQVTPRTLTVAAHLMNMGARHGEIMRGLNRVHSLSSLRLWGLALSRLEQDPSLDFVWTTLTQADFLHTNATPETLAGVFEELLQYSPQARLVALISQGAEGIRVSLHAQIPLSAADFARLFGADGTREQAHFSLKDTTDIVRAKPFIIDTLKQTLKQFSPK